MTDEPTDHDLLKRLTDGDAGAFDHLVARHEAVVRRQARRLLAWRTDVDDVVQDVFLALWRGHCRFRGESSLSTWLLTIAIRECRRKLRRELLWNRTIGKLRIVAGPMGESHRCPVGDEDESRHVASAVAALPARLREVVVLHYLESMPITDVAKVLQLKRSVVDVRLHRARVRLAETIGNSHSAGEST